MITSDVGVILDLPRVKISSQVMSDTDENGADKIVRIVASCIKNIFDQENVYDVRSETPEEVYEFVENMPSQKLEEIKGYFDKMPSIEYRDTVDCPGEKEEIVVREIEDFFL